MSDARLERLARYFGSVVHGKQEVEDPNGFKRLVEAILAQQDPCILVERVVTSESALKALRNGLRFNITPVFINQYTAKLILFLKNREVKLLCNGSFLEQLLVIILEPRTLWNSFVEAFRARKLEDHAIIALCWMISELLALPSSSGVDIRADAELVIGDGLIFSSPLVELHNLGHKIKHLIEMKSSAETIITAERAAGGRHDNDFADFRSIAILPTADEMGCTERPFYRQSENVAQLSASQRIAGHIDNQFRLLREDMLSGLRDDFQIAQGTKKEKRGALRLGDLSLAHIECFSENNNGRKRIQPCTVGVTCKSGLDRVSKLPQSERKVFLKNNPSFVKHRAFGCLIRGTEIVGFATIERNIEKLALEPPVVMLRISGEEALKKSLLYLKLYSDLRFLVVDTPIFAYEPILKCLQESIEIPLTEELFLYERGQPVKDSNLAPWDMINQLKEVYNCSIQNILQTTKPVTLDPSQLESLLAGLTQRVSLIQGPPGMKIINACNIQNRHS
jgi:hypothetical protein